MEEEEEEECKNTQGGSGTEGKGGRAREMLVLMWGSLYLEYFSFEPDMLLEYNLL